MNNKTEIDYKKYKWFFTSSSKLVVGGKSSQQNDELIKELKETKQDFLVMHTSTPGSPFSVILEDIKKISPQDVEEVAIFTACFSRAWRDKKQKAVIDIFSLAQLYKSQKMKPGTWGVRGLVRKKTASLELALTKQKNILRAVPLQTIKNKKDIILKIRPGKVDKTEMLPKLQVEMSDHFSQDELLQALPAGGLSIVRK